MRVLIHRIDQTAHISLQKLSISKSARQNHTKRHLLLAQPASDTSVFFAVCPSRASLRRSVWRPVVRLSDTREPLPTHVSFRPQHLFLDIVSKIGFWRTQCSVRCSISSKEPWLEPLPRAPFPPRMAKTRLIQVPQDQESDHPADSYLVDPVSSLAAQIRGPAA